MGGTRKKRIVKATFGGKPLYHPGPNSFTLQMGVAPSTGTVTMVQTDLEALTKKNTGFKLVLNDGGAPITIDKLYIRSVQHSDPVDAIENVVNVTIEDRRSLWAPELGGPNIDGYYNILREDGKTYIASSINGEDPWTFDELLQKLLDKLGTGLKATTGVSWTPGPVVWESANAAAMLHQLLSAASWDIALQPNGKFELLDLSQGAKFTPPAGKTITSKGREQSDDAHITPKELEVKFYTVREIAHTGWEPVLRKQDDDAQGATDSVTSGEWDTASNVVGKWGTSLEQIHEKFYGQANEYNGKIDALGGGDRGMRRWKDLRSQLYRFWRLTDSQRDNYLPLLPLKATTGTQDGRATALQGQVVAADAHLPRLSKWTDYFRNVTDRSKVRIPIRIVDAREGIVEVLWRYPLCGVRPIDKTSQANENGYALQSPSAPTIEIAYYKKVYGTPANSFHSKTAATGKPNNGQTATRLNKKIALREVRDSSGAFQAQNQTEIDALAEAYLDAWRQQYALQDPETIEFAGVDPSVKLTTALQAIEWRFDGGVSSAYRVNSDRAPDRYGLGLSARVTSTKFAGAAQAAVLMDEDGGSGGGGGYGLAPSSTPVLHDHQGTRETAEAPDGRAPSFLNPQYGGLLVAVDLRPGKSKDDCTGPKRPQITGRGRAQTSGQRPTTQVTHG